MTWYLGYVQGGKTTKPEGVLEGEPKSMKRIDRQFYVEREIEGLGVECYLPRKMEFKRSGHSRRAEPHTTPLLPNYIFVNPSPEQFLGVLGVKYLIPTLMMLTRRDIEHMEQFKAVADENFKAAEKISQNQDAIAEYVKGQKLAVIEGGLAEHTLTFKGMIDRANDFFPKIQAEIEMMGRVVTVELDPLNVKAAE